MFMLNPLRVNLPKFYYINKHSSPNFTLISNQHLKLYTPGTGLSSFTFSQFSSVLFKSVARVESGVKSNISVTDTAGSTPGGGRLIAWKSQIHHFVVLLFSDVMACKQLIMFCSQFHAHVRSFPRPSRLCPIS